MLLVLMYHSIKEIDIFQSYIKYISKKYPIVIPGDILPSSQLSICLTFDDAYFDFYHYVYPLIQEENIRAVVGVPVKYILDETSIDIKTRLNVPYDEAMKNDTYIKKAPFCTWKELKEMVNSGSVKVASHSTNHLNMTLTGVDLDNELVASKKFIQQKLSQEINTFVYPYGKVNRKVHYEASMHYKYLMRIGSALNKDWHNSNNMIYRVNGDSFMKDKGPKKLSFFKYYLKYLSNTIRRK